ncbi:TRAP transporter substrate-binding protein DctP [Bradyrhizobium sp. Pear76]|uniref:TRAP transporter substrate-binding protein n=1 Tax=Bradyrhizobium oropedii TaxID=1571201 RepID=UPI001E32AC96|nr:TRAP transporter substrate-binding protein [Bradyrhizobium oropedii]MCC8960903.1 TRAP transporter substrate-binding protein DctP [Bradyrhizobium oropedii]
MNRTDRSQHRGAGLNRRDLIKIGAGLGAIAATSAQTAVAQSKAVFKASDVQPPGYPTVVATENLGKKLAAATNGRLSLQMFPSMQLGGEKETIEQTQIGAIQMLRVSAGSIGPIVDDINVVNMPFLFKNMAHAERMMDGPIGQELLDKITASPNAGLVALCWMNSGARSLYNTKHSIKTIADIKGLKFRVIGNPIFIDMMNALGGNGVAMGYDQVFSALQTGVIDGAENNPPSYVFSNHYTAAKHFTLTEHLIVPELLVFSKRAWSALSADDQTLIRKLARDAQMEERGLWNTYEQQAMDKAKAAGCEIIEIADKAPFQNAVKPVWDKYGPKYQDMIGRIQSA